MSDTERKIFTVHVMFPFPLVGAETVQLSATSPEHATMRASAKRALMGWPRGCTYSAREVDARGYRPPWTHSIPGGL